MYFYIMASVQVFDSFEKLKADRVIRSLTKEEKMRQLKATKSIKNIKRKEKNSSLNG